MGKQEILELVERLIADDEAQWKVQTDHFDNAIAEVKSEFERKFVNIQEHFNNRLKVLENSDAAALMFADFKNNKESEINNLKNQLKDQIEALKKAIEEKDNSAKQFEADRQNLIIKHELEIDDWRKKLSDETNSHAITRGNLKIYEDNIGDNYKIFLKVEAQGMIPRENDESLKYERFIQLCVTKDYIKRCYDKMCGNVYAENYDEQLDNFINYLLKIYNNINSTGNKLYRQTVEIGTEFRDNIHCKIPASPVGTHVSKIALQGIQISQNVIFENCKALVELK